MGLPGLPKNPEIHLSFVTFNSFSDSGELLLLACVMLNCKGHQTVALSFLCSLLSCLWQMGTD